MAIIKCKMCGGDLNLIEGASTAECEFCGSVQTIPKVDDEKKLTLFARANRLRMACEFDKAAGIYEAIVTDFPEEAEAYWGLVLCKYGIEYVDDPATGKKIPTCHRSSFDSIMEDSDFEQALENADGAARRVYREEAKQIEKIRKGIISVSSNEQPYDIFICYKETAETGKRTLDSVLAQDLYSALSDKGYRVFFSRITLQGKLGEAYEPYIFAALNSAKVMLAIGTDPEYYSAVWVKNEWSRYLKICAVDKSKHLIPCYKDLDPEDMPKEFRHLQGADLGKMGAVQDILFNMEKYIPLKKQTTTVIQEKVVVGSSGDNKIASLLDRGNMALEDGDWDKADSFFEDVLNNDSKNAQAYLGKTLAVEQCRTLDALVRKQKDAYYPVRKPQTLQLQPDTARADAAAQQYVIWFYVLPAKIRELYTFDLTYTSVAEERKHQRQDAESWWKNHKWLSRAEKFAAGDLVRILQCAYNDLMSALDERLAQAVQAETQAREQLQSEYAAHLEQADQKAKELYESGVKKREEEYQFGCQLIKTETDIHDLETLRSKFQNFDGYKESEAMAEKCLKKIQEITARRQAEATARAVELREKEERRQAEANAQAARKARAKAAKKIGVAVAIAAAAVLAFILFTRIIPGNKYDEAVQLYQAGEYKQAFEIYYKIRNYGDSLEQAYACADALEIAGEKEYAAIYFGKLGDYSDALQRKNDLWAQITTRETISGNDYMACLKTDGTVRRSGYGDEVYWSDIIAVSKGFGHTLGLKSNGTVVAIGDSNRGECDVSEWTDIVAISAGMHHSVGLKSDGTVVLTGKSYDSFVNTSLEDVTEWTDIISVDIDAEYIIGLKADGTVEIAGKMPNVTDSMTDLSTVTEWTDIVAITAGFEHAVGLKSDGTVVAAGNNKHGQCDVSEWTDITEVRAGTSHTLGLRADGTVVAVGNDDYDKCSKVSEWSGIVTIAASSRQSAGVKADGTVIAVGDKYFDVYDDVYEWTNVKIPE